MAERLGHKDPTFKDAVEALKEREAQLLEIIELAKANGSIPSLAHVSEHVTRLYEVHSLIETLNAMGE